ncbi:hypothetical protein DUNSADRAFT_18694 [Dunaliella salina]|uniref:Major facilitator superfamily (MFS) profile domain-containing protein n=1 Tax=Dunaliella salina TaxID=3046 RepID=A0ABQ7FZN6_DUNSA|nr:hypothetical protein DUNSADRAFT_18694 [Dunaliella salina]|eukprot:KAF5827811.1 hypothetical protein DUNSADRAFT_18694 [Dunaliella salina]
MLAWTAMIAYVAAAASFYCPPSALQAEHVGHILVSTLLLMSRFLIASAYFLLYIYTPMLLPTQVRAFGLGICNAISRLGGMAAPLVAVELVEEGLSQASLAVFAGLCLVSGILMAFIGARTKGQELRG